MDWSRVRIPQIKSKRLQTTKLADLDYCKFIVAALLIEKSQSQSLQTAVYTYLKNTWAQHEERLIFDAAQQNITPEELFERMINEALSGSKPEE